MMEKEINIPVRVIEDSGKIKYAICHTYPDSFHNKKHKLLNPFKKVKNYIDKLSLERDLNAKRIEDDLNYKIDNKGRLYVESDGLKMYVSEDLQYVEIDGMPVNMLLTKDNLMLGREHHFEGPFPYKFLYEEDKMAYLKKWEDFKKLTSVYDEEEKGNVIDINDYLKKGR